ISYLHDRGLTPGTRLALASAPSATESDATVDLSVGDERIPISTHAAYALWVVPVEASAQS
ncbi:MAG: hypothetical protein ACXWQR_05615, partial [Ktedonobacterales bacterium]